MSRPSRSASLALGVVVWLALAGAAGAGEARRRFSFRHYGDEHGLGNLTVTSLAQDAAGFLWVGTQDGLYRFDGQQFVRFGREEGLPSVLVDSLFQTRDGVLWVGTAQGLARRTGETFRAYGPADGLTATGIPGIAQDASGRLWIANRQGLRVLRGDRFEDGGLAGRWPGDVSALCAGPDGSLWLGGVGRVGRLEGGRLDVFGPEVGLPAVRFEALLFDTKGELWVRSAGRLLSQPPGGTRFVDRGAGLPPSNSFGTLYLDRDGDLWVPTDFGLARRTREAVWDIVGQNRGLTSDAVLAVLQDREGLLWVGLGGTGLDCWLGYPSWTAITTSEGLNNDAVWAVTRDAAGALWVGTDMGLNRLDPSSGRWRAWGAAQGLGGECAYTLLHGKSGELWIGLYPGGIARLDARRERFETYGPGDGLAGDRVNALALTADGALWVAATEGLFRAAEIAGKRSFERVVVPGGEARESYSALLADSRGRLWAGGSRGLGLLEAGRWRRFTKRDGLRDDDIGYLAEAAADGSLWIGYWEPLGTDRLQLQGEALRIEHIDRSSGLASDSVQALTTDRAGRVWIGTSRGVNVLESGRLRHYGRADGLIWDYVNTFHVEPGGDLWIGTSKGLAHLEPHARGPLPPPNVVLLSARLGGQPFPIDVPAEVKHSQGTLELAFAGLTFRKPEQLRFRYRLAGLEDSPIETSLRQVRYPRLPPGRYSFEVECRNEDGTWSPKATPFQVRVLPPWYRTPLALVGGALLSVLAAGLAYKARVRQLLAAQRRLEEAVVQRTLELAREKQIVEEQAQALVEAAEERRRVYAMVVHDLKNPLTPILGGLDFLEDGLRPDFGPGQQALQTIRHAARRMLFLIESYTATLRATTQEGQLRWRGFGALDLVCDLALSYAPATRRRGLQLLVDGAPVDERWFPSRGGTLVDAPAEKVYRALENILGNAVKYAAGEIRLSVEERNGRVGLVVENDGASIPDADKERIFGVYQQLGNARPGTGLGLASAQREVHELGGEIRVADAVTGGVRFEVWLPRMAGPEA